jgi:hypothetical protein
MREQGLSQERILLSYEEERWDLEGARIYVYGENGA